VTGFGNLKELCKKHLFYQACFCIPLAQVRNLSKARHKRPVPYNSVLKPNYGLCNEGHTLNVALSCKSDEWVARNAEKERFFKASSPELCAGLECVSHMS
jgi:hypothetical protein